MHKRNACIVTVLWLLSKPSLATFPVSCFLCCLFFKQIKHCHPNYSFSGFTYRITGVCPIQYKIICGKVFFPPTWPLVANCCESCLVEFPLLYLAVVQNSFIKPVVYWRLFHYPTFRFFQLFGNFFNWQASRSKYRRLGFQVAELFSINRVHLSWYSQNRGKIVSNSGHKIRQIFGGKI